VDRFRDRLMLPVRDPEGRVIAFVGRAAPDAGGEVPRYLYSPETPLFTKGNVLFGLAESRLRWQSGSTPVLVEGPLGAIAVSLATDGRYAGVAPCGTALSRSQAKSLANAAAIGGRLVVAVDADPAGQPLQ
jgi:DNA primase